MASMNRQLNLPQIQRILQEFEKQSEIMDMKEDVMNEAIDDAMEGDDDEEERSVHINLTGKTIINYMLVVLVMLLSIRF